MKKLLAAIVFVLALCISAVNTVNSAVLPDCNDVVGNPEYTGYCSAVPDIKWVLQGVITGD